MIADLLKTFKISCGMQLLTAMLALLSLAVGCRSVTEYLSYTRNEPNKQDFVGTWTPNEGSLKSMRDKGGYDTSLKTKLVLRENGNFELTNMPDWWGNGFGRSQQGFIHYSGTWGISQNAAQFWELYLRSETEARSVQLLGQEPPYQLSFFIGDPDSDNRMVFVKTL